MTKAQFAGREIIAHIAFCAVCESKIGRVAYVFSDKVSEERLCEMCFNWRMWGWPFTQ